MTHNRPPPQFTCTVCGHKQASEGVDSLVRVTDPVEVKSLWDRVESKWNFANSREKGTQEWDRAWISADTTLNEYINETQCTGAWRFPIKTMTTSFTKASWTVHCLSCKP